MNFEFSDEQNLLREQAQRFLVEQSPLSAVRAVLDDSDTPFDADVWLYSIAKEVTLLLRKITVHNVSENIFSTDC